MTTKIQEQYTMFSPSTTPVPASQLTFEINGKRYSIADLYVEDRHFSSSAKRVVDNTYISSYDHLVKVASKKKLHVITGASTTEVKYGSALNSTTGSTDYFIQYADSTGNVVNSYIEQRNIEIPNQVDSLKIDDSIPYGLKRNVKMNPDPNGKFLLVKIDGETRYLERKEIYFVNGAGEKTSLESIALADIPNVQLFEEGTDKGISEIYTKTFFQNESAIKQEEINFDAMEKKTYTTNTNSNPITFNDITVALEPNFSELEYFQESVEGKAGKEETESFVKAKNYTLDNKGDLFIIVKGKKIPLSEINEINFTKTREHNKPIVFSDLKNGAEITIGGVSKKLTEEEIKSHSKDNQGEYIVVNNNNIYFKDIEEISYNKVFNPANPATPEDLKNGIGFEIVASGGSYTLDNGEWKVFSTYGDYVEVSVNGQTRMVSIDMLRDENDNSIVQMKDLVGKRLFVYENQEVGDSIKLVQIAQTDPVTYEQANMQYSERKCFQESKKEKADNTTYRKLESGEMVKESLIQKPKAFKLAQDSDPSSTTGDYDAYLAKVTQNGNEKYVILDKNYFKKYGNTTQFQQSLPDVVRISRCEVADSKCVAIQTTSRGQDVEECSCWKGVTKQEKLDKLKNDGLGAFKTGLKDESYLIDDVLKDDGTVEKLDKEGKRYEYTSEVTFKDYSANTWSYQYLDTKGLSIKDGKLVGAVKYKAGEQLKKQFMAWGQVAGMCIGPIVALSFIPVVGVAAQVLYGAFLVAGMAGIPLGCGFNVVRKNNLQLKAGKLFPNKTEYNQVELEKELTSEIQALYKKARKKSFTKENFEHEIAKLKQKAYALSRGNDNSVITVVDGEASITQDNVNAAIKYQAEYNDTKKQLAKFEKKLSKGKIESFAEWLVKITKGKFSPFVKLQNMRQEKRIQAANDLRDDFRFVHYTEKLEALKNGKFSTQSLESMKENTKKYIDSKSALLKLENDSKELVAVEAQIASLESSKKLTDKIKLGYLKRIQKKLKKSVEDLKDRKDQNEIDCSVSSEENAKLNKNNQNLANVAESKNMQDTLTSIDLMRAVVYLTEYSASNEVRNYFGSATPGLRPNPISFDKKKGLMVNGKDISQYNSGDYLYDFSQSLVAEEANRNERYNELSMQEERMAEQQAEGKHVESQKQQEARNINEAILNNIIKKSSKVVYDNRKQEIDDLRDEILVLEDEQSKIEKRISGLRKKKNYAEKALKKYKETNNDAINTNNANLQKAENDVKILKIEVDTLRSKYEAEKIANDPNATKTKSELAQKLKDLSSKTEECGQYEKEKAKFEKEIAKRQQAVDNNQAMLDNANKALEDTKKEIQEKTDRTIDLENRNNNYEEFIANNP